MIDRGPRIVLAPGSGPGVGGGHVMRCLALANALAARGAVCGFICGPAGAEIIGRYGGGKFPIVGSPPLSASTLRQVESQSVDAVIVDDYRLDAVQETPLRAEARVIMVIDDLADRRHDCDLLLDPGYGRVRADYEGLIPMSAVGLFGPSYALLRPAFAPLRDEALSRARPKRIDRLFINFGLSDVGGVAARAYGALRANLATTQVDLVVAGDATSLPQLRSWAQTDSNLTLHIDSAQVAELMAKADAAIGAGGASTWERASLGLPTLAVVVADNQRAMIGRLCEDGLLLSVDLHASDFESRLGATYDRLGDLKLRTELAERTADLCDGQGADRAAEALMRRLTDRP